MNYNLVPIKNKGIHSSFNNARKSNVGINSCGIMQRAYQKAIEKLNTKIDSISSRVDDLRSSNEILQSDVTKNLQEGTQIHQDLEQIEDPVVQQSKVEESEKNEQELIALGTTISKNNKMIQKEEKKISRFEKWKSSLENKLVSPMDPVDGGVHSSMNAPQIVEEETPEYEIGDIPSISAVDPTIQAVDPMAHIKEAFNSFLDQITVENESFKKENKELKEENKSLKEENEGLIDDLSEMNEYQQTVVKKVNEANEAIRKENQQALRLSQQIQQQNQEIARLKKENEEINQKLQDKTSELLMVNRQFKEFTSTMQQVSDASYDSSQNKKEDNGRQYINQPQSQS